MESRLVVVVEKMNQFVQRHIVLQGLRTAAQGGIQGDIPLGPMAVAPLTAHDPEFHLGHINPQGGHQGIDPLHRSLQKGLTLLSVR